MSLKQSGNQDRRDCSTTYYIEHQKGKKRRNDKDWGDARQEKEEKEKSFNKLTKKFTKCQGNSQLGRWELKAELGGLGVLRVFWHILELLTDDLDIIVAPKYIHEELTPDRRRMEAEAALNANEGTENIEEPTESSSDQLKRELARMNEEIKGRNRAREAEE